MPPRFDNATLELLGRTPEVQIETTSAEGAVHRTTIWVVTVGHEAFVRSEYAESGRWYRETRARPNVILHVGGSTLPVTAALVEDAATIQAVSNALEAKYRPISAASTAAMILPHTLEHTLRLDPR
jgi:hypothetical protein